jgi:hypothetical protein
VSFGIAGGVEPIDWQFLAPLHGENDRTRYHPGINAIRAFLRGL